MKVKEIRELSAEALEKKAIELKRELGIDRGSASGGSKTAGKIRSLRRTIARMLCIRREKELNIHQTKEAKNETKQPNIVSNEKIAKKDE